MRHNKVKKVSGYYENIAKKIKKNLNKPVVLFMAVAISLGGGYIAGTYHYQIEAAMGPVFGYNAHSGTINLSSLQETYNKLAANYDGEIDTAKLIDGANKGMVDALGDRYTVYFDSKEATEFTDSLNGNYGAGIGAVIGIKNEKITIIKPIADNPAIRAGLQTNDVILKVNEQTIEGWSVDRAVNLIRGDAGTTVKLTIQRGDDVKEYSVTRAVINNPSVESSIDGKVGLLTISRFDNQTGDLAKTAALEFKRQGVDSIILDLRDNGGGYVDSAVDVAGLWLDNKIVVTERNGSDIKDTLRSGSNPILAGLPTVVLVNGQTASASEIVTGALKDYGVARVIGETTFGKGSVQLPVDLSGGSLMKITVARWYTPNGVNLSDGGIVPDKNVSLTQTDFDNSVDPQMIAAKEELNA